MALQLCQVDLDGRSMSEQLEFDLWAEARVSELDIVTGRTKALIAETYHDAFLYGESRVMMWRDPMSMHTIIRWRV